MHSFGMLTFVFLLTGIGIVLVCFTGIFVANVLLITVLLCTEHMPLRQDTWTYHACTICDKLAGGKGYIHQPFKEGGIQSGCL